MHVASIDDIRTALTAAIKDRDVVATSALRSALAAISTAERAGTEKRELSSEEIEAVLAKEVKRRDEAAEGFKAGGRDDRAERELAERKILAAYLPEPLGEAEIEAIVDEVLAEGAFSGVASMGQAMRAVMERLQGRADGKVVSGLVRARLSATDA